MKIERTVPSGSGSYGRVQITYESSDLPDVATVRQVLLATLSDDAVGYVNSSLLRNAVETEMKRRLDVAAIDIPEKFHKYEGWERVTANDGKLRYNIRHANDTLYARIDGVLRKLEADGTIVRVKRGERAESSDGTARTQSQESAYATAVAAKRITESHGKAVDAKTRSEAAWSEQYEKLAQWAAEHGVSISAQQSYRNSFKVQRLPNAPVLISLDDLERLLIAAADNERAGR